MAFKTDEKIKTVFYVTMVCLIFAACKLRQDYRYARISESEVGEPIDSDKIPEKFLEILRNHQRWLSISYSYSADPNKADAGSIFTKKWKLNSDKTQLESVIPLSQYIDAKAQGTGEDALSIMKWKKRNISLASKLNLTDFEYKWQGEMRFEGQLVQKEEESEEEVNRPKDSTFTF